MIDNELRASCEHVVEGDLVTTLGVDEGIVLFNLNERKRETLRGELVAEFGYLFLLLQEGEAGLEVVLGSRDLEAVSIMGRKEARINSRLLLPFCCFVGIAAGSGVVKLEEIWKSMS